MEFTLRDLESHWNRPPALLPSCLVPRGELGPTLRAVECGPDGMWRIEHRDARFGHWTRAFDERFTTVELPFFGEP